MSEPSDEARVLAEDAIYGAGPEASLSRVAAALQKLMDERDAHLAVSRQVLFNGAAQGPGRYVNVDVGDGKMERWPLESHGDLQSILGLMGMGAHPENGNALLVWEDRDGDPRWVGIVQYG